jgi:hypothetical protein
MLWRNRVFLNSIGCSRKVENICKMTQEVGSKSAKDSCKCGQSTNLGALRTKIRSMTNSRRIEYEQENSATDYYGWFGNKKTFRKVGAPNLDKWPETMSASYFTWSFTQCEMFDRVITDEETWCFQYDPETKRQSMQWKTQIHLGRERGRMSRSQFKTMLVCFFDHKGIVHYEFIAQGQTVNQQCYLEVLTRLLESGKCWQGFGNLGSADKVTGIWEVLTRLRVSGKCWQGYGNLGSADKVSGIREVLTTLRESGKCWQGYGNLGSADKVTGIWEMLTRLRESGKYWQGYGNLFGGKDPNSGLTIWFSTMTMSLHMMR